MSYNFDEIIERRGSGSLKTDGLKERFGDPDLIPMWVADMDFRTGGFIVKALKERCEHEVFGYSLTPDDFFPSIIKWLHDNHQWDVKREWLEFVPGIVKGIAFCVMHFTNPGDKVIIQPPVYHPFRLVPEMHGRIIVNNPLEEKDGKYRMNLDHLRKVIDKDCKLLILCNPHNPVGIIWDKETLAELADICYENNILVISDEIHADMALFGNKHLPYAMVSEKARENSITFMAPSKTFNIAGIVSSFCVIPNQTIRAGFFRFLHASELNEGHIFAYAATIAAYKYGQDWLKQMLKYIEGNILFTEKYLEKNIPQIKAVIPQASFLVWLDCRDLNLSQKELLFLFKERARLALNDGTMFGPGGEGFMRMNIGCSRKIIERALENLKKVIN